MDLKIALSGDLPARCSDALAALAPELGMVPAAEGVPVRGHRGAALAVCCDGASVTIEWAQPSSSTVRSACCPVRWQLAISGKSPALRRSA